MPEYLDRAEAADYLTGRGLKIKKGTSKNTRRLAAALPIGALATKQSTRPMASTDGSSRNSARRVVRPAKPRRLPPGHDCPPEKVRAPFRLWPTTTPER
jgi:hypothetical protein